MLSVLGWSCNETDSAEVLIRVTGGGCIGGSAAVACRLGLNTDQPWQFNARYLNRYDRPLTKLAAVNQIDIKGSDELPPATEM